VIALQHMGQLSREPVAFEDTIRGGILADEMGYPHSTSLA